MYTEAFIREHQRDRFSRLRRLAGRRRPPRTAARAQAPRARAPRPEERVIVLDDVPARERERAAPRTG